jgi:hypothetical protein
VGNPFIGAVTFEASNKVWTLRYAINELCLLESTMDKSVSEIVAEMQDPSKVRLTSVRTLFWAGLSGSHKILPSEAGDLIAEIGTDTAVELISKAFALAFPSEGKAPDAHPRKGREHRARGIGKLS